MSRVGNKPIPLPKGVKLTIGNELTVEGPLEEGVHVRAEVTTFVRDIVTASAMLGAPRGGDPAGMR